MWWRNHKHRVVIALNVILSMSLFGSFLMSTTGIVSGNRNPDVLSSTTTVSANYSNAQLQDTANLINKTRIESGRAELKRSADLDIIAEKRAADMQKNVYYAHKSPDGRYFNDLMNEDKISYTFACENLNINDTYDSSYFVQSWLDSKAGHKECMLRDSHTKAGYAVVSLPSKNGIALNQTIVVAIYAD